MFAASPPFSSDTDAVGPPARASDPRLRPGAPADLPALAAIETAVFSGDRIAPRSFRALLRSRSAAFILAEAEGGSLLGYALVLFRARVRVARLYSLAVSPEAAGRGIGRLLLAAAEREAHGRGAAFLRLEVREDNARAARLYASTGFCPIGRVPAYYADGAAALRFEKALRRPS